MNFATATRVRTFARWCSRPWKLGLVVLVVAFLSFLMVRNYGVSHPNLILTATNLTQVAEAIAARETSGYVTVSRQSQSTVERAHHWKGSKVDRVYTLVEIEPGRLLVIEKHDRLRPVPICIPGQRPNRDVWASSSVPPHH